jgi:hypothetical protein
MKFRSLLVGPDSPFLFGVVLLVELVDGLLGTGYRSLTLLFRGGVPTSNLLCLLLTPCPIDYIRATNKVNYAW